MGNKVILTNARLCRDVYVFETRRKDPIAVFTVAVTRRGAKRKNKYGRSKADFINIWSYGKIAEVAEKYLKKGSSVNIQAKIQAGMFTAWKSPTKERKPYMHIIAESIEFANIRYDERGDAFEMDESCEKPVKAVKVKPEEDKPKSIRETIPASEYEGLDLPDFESEIAYVEKQLANQKSDEEDEPDGESEDENGE